jgi:nucleoside-diphosphate-sugar epimerase
VSSLKIILPGGAGLVGQNLVARLKQRGYRQIVVIDKNGANLQILRQQHPEITIVLADLAEPGDWHEYFADANVVVMLQAQIGAIERTPFERNNVTTTVNILQIVKQYQVPHIVHVSSSVLDSVADDDYTSTKREQERLVIASGIDCVVLRPTLMFGWFDRKHFGWLSRFMQRVPVFPIPGNGRYMRQPLYVGDFCNVIISCIEQGIGGDQMFRISGLERVDYIDIIKAIKKAVSARCLIIKIPYGLFAMLLRVWALFDKNPPFTDDQLQALIARDEFPVIDWPHIFSVQPTSFNEAITETFNHPIYSKVVLEF